MGVAPLKKNSRVKGYSVEEYCGSGTYGEVWKGKHRLGGTAAIKSFARLAQIVRQDRLLGEILREARAQAEVEHENVVRLFDWEPKRACLIFEYLPSSLTTVLKERRGRDWFSTDKALDIVTGILEGLQAIHGKQRVHGDLKPANILMTEKLTPKISDFGMASILSEKRFPVPLFRGSNNWAAPEVLSGQTPDYRSDLFSAGIIAYILFGRRHPFRCEDPCCLSSPEEHIDDPSYSRKALKEIDADIPDGISQVVEKLLQREPDKRYQSVGEVLIALSALRAPAPATIAGDPESAKEIASAIVEAKRAFALEYDLEKALRTLDAVIDKHAPQAPIFLANAYSYKAFVHNYLREWDYAEDAASKGIELDPNHGDSYMVRGYARKQRAIEAGKTTASDFDAARQDLESAQLLAQDYRSRRQTQEHLDKLP